jgi:DNA-binding NarL/FixJ family response regulator
LADNSIQKQEHDIYIIGNDGILNELLVYFLQQSKEPSFNCSLHKSFSLLNIQDTKGPKKLVLCNCQDVLEHDQPVACERHIAAAPSNCYWACVNVPHDRKVEEKAINNGVHGIFYENDSLEILKRGIKAILNGELWFSRDIMSATLSSLVERNTYKSSQGDADQIDLTKREKEVLKLIALGKTNEEIAEKLNISALTVKTHVSNIYRKINVPNRIQAIFWTTKNFVHLKD